MQGCTVRKAYTSYWGMFHAFMILWPISFPDYSYIFGHYFIESVFYQEILQEPLLGGSPAGSL